jgi:hypothetical protein
VREIAESYYRKEEEDYRWNLCQVEWKVLHAGQKGENFNFRWFLYYP